MHFDFEQAAEYIADVARIIAEDNAQAVPVLISCASGPFAQTINGLFAPSLERSSDGRVVYKKCDFSDMIIEHCRGQWAVKPLHDKGRGAMQCAVVGGCAFELCVRRESEWFVATGDRKWTPKILKITMGADIDRQVIGLMYALQRDYFSHLVRTLF